MTPTELKQARIELGLSVNQMASMLRCSSVHVRRMETTSHVPSARPINPQVERLIEHWRAGLLPDDWPV